MDSASDWSARLRDVEPRAILVPAHLVKRIIRRDLQTGLTVFYSHSHHIEAEKLLRIVAPREVDRSAVWLRSQSEVILVSRPEGYELQADALRRLWRSLFHELIVMAVRSRFAGLEDPRGALRARIDGLGQAVFDEASAVLEQDELLLPPTNDLNTYAKFAAHFCELDRFYPAGIGPSFPSIDDLQIVRDVLSQDLDLDQLFETSRLVGAAEPVDVVATEAPEAAPAPENPTTAAVSARLIEKASGLVSSGVGNDVRAAILTQRAAGGPDPGRQLEARRLSAEALQRLVGRLCLALGEGPAAARWLEALRPLLPYAALGLISSEARLLFDLQKVCVASERVTYKLDPLTWCASMGAEPLLRPLRDHGLVQGLRHLRSASGRLRTTRLGQREQAGLTLCLEEAQSRSEGLLREKVRPLILGAIEEQLSEASRSLPEEVALNKLVEELLDRLVQRGFLTMGDLRDGLSGGALKLPDMTRVSAFVMGDELLKVDRRLHRELDAAYRRGEVYMRWLQRLSALAFGTRMGRWLTLWVALPFGSAYMGISGLLHLYNPLAAFLGWPMMGGVSLLPFLGLSAVLLAMIHLPVLRQATWKWAVTAVGSTLGALAAFPRWLLCQAWFRRFMAHPLVGFGWRFVLKPSLVSLALGGAYLWSGPPEGSWWLGGAVFLGANLWLNSRAGRRVEDVAVNWVLTNWRYLVGRLVPGVFDFVLATFERAMDRVEFWLYVVDEWLRFKSSDRHLSRVLKGLMGLGWSVLTYVVRIYVKLLIEPQLNPIKHFPVVTVSHKIILPLSIKLTLLFAVPLAFLGPVLSKAIAGATVFLLPGVFGFLVWELKENWRLYRANRPKGLKPVRVGHHGETVLKLMKPGFHSGTLPRTFRKLRGAQKSGSWKSLRKHRRRLQQVRHAVRIFVERELVTLLELHGGLRGLRVQGVELGSNRIVATLSRRGFEGEASLLFEERSGWLVMDLRDEGMVGGLDQLERASLDRAFEGFGKLSGADVLRSHVRRCLPPGTPYDVGAKGLLVWPGDDYEVEVVYDLTQRPTMLPMPSHPLLEPISAAALVFSITPVLWFDWVQGWERTRDR